MADALNRSVAPFCHSQNHSGGVPVAVLDQPAGQTGESAFVQHQPLGSRKACYNESHEDVREVRSRLDRSRLCAQSEDAVQALPFRVQPGVPRAKQGQDSGTAGRVSPRASRESQGRSVEVGREAHSRDSGVHAPRQVRAQLCEVQRDARSARRGVLDLQAATDQQAQAARRPRSCLLCRAEVVWEVRACSSMPPLQPWTRGLHGRSCATEGGQQVPPGVSATRVVDGLVPQEPAAMPLLDQCALSRCAGAQAVTVAHCFFHSQKYTREGYIVPTPTSSQQSAASPWRSSSGVR